MRASGEPGRGFRQPYVGQRAIEERADQAGRRDAQELGGGRDLVADIDNGIGAAECGRRHPPGGSLELVGPRWELGARARRGDPDRTDAVGHVACCSCRPGGQYSPSPFDWRLPLDLGVCASGELTAMGHPAYGRPYAGPTKRPGIVRAFHRNVLREGGVRSDGDRSQLDSRHRDAEQRGARGRRGPLRPRRSDASRRADRG